MISAANLLSGARAHVAGAMRAIAFLSLVTALLPLQFYYKLMKPDQYFSIPQLCYRGIITLLGFRVRVHGFAASVAPVMFVSNHSSYLDIPVLGALLPAAFVAKADVAGWPLIGFLAKIQNTVFIERRAREAGAQRDELRQCLAAGQSLIVFPEGTSSDGATVLPFKSALFSATEESKGGVPATVQPVSVLCTEIDGMPVTRALRPFYAWYGDMTLAGHLWKVFKFGHCTVDVVFHPPVAPGRFPDRKALAAYCQQQTALGVERLMLGRGLEGDVVPKLLASH